MQTSEDGANSTISELSSLDTTSQTISGPRESKTAIAKFDDYVDRLEKYVKFKGVPESLPRHVDHYLSMSRSELSKTSSRDLGEMAYELYATAYHIQTVNNLQLAKAEYCKHQIDKIYGRDMDNYSHIYGKEDKYLRAIADSETCQSYREIEINARGAATRTSYLTQRLENVAKCIENIVRERLHG